MGNNMVIEAPGFGWEVQVFLRYLLSSWVLPIFRVWCLPSSALSNLLGGPSNLQAASEPVPSSGCLSCSLGASPVPSTRCPSCPQGASPFLRVPVRSSGCQSPPQDAVPFLRVAVSSSGCESLPQAASPVVSMPRNNVLRARRSRPPAGEKL